MSTRAKISAGTVAAVALALGLAVAWRVQAAEHPTEHPAPPAKSEKVALAKPFEATVTGSNFCLGCALKKQFEAGSQCSIYGHKHSLRVTKAVADGKDVPQMNGWVLHYLETDKSQDLINKRHGENLTVTGKVYPNERVLEVASVEKDRPKKPEHPEHPR